MNGSRGAELILGLDGGGTKTLIAVANRESDLVFACRGETVDPFAPADWQDRLAHVVAGVGAFRDCLAAAAFGLPCHGEVADLSERQREVSGRLVRGPCAVVNDVHAAFDGAFVGEPGILLLAGTGSMAWAGNADRQIRVGGWGEAFGDEGSAFWIGREALSEATQAIDSRGGSRDFANRLLKRLDVESGQLLAWCYGPGSRRAAIAGVAAVVDELAEMGDGQARALLIRAADHIAHHAHACGEPLGLERPYRWSHAGSVFRSRIVMNRLMERLETEPLPPKLPPVGGALLRAARLAGWPVDDVWIQRLARSLSAPERGLHDSRTGERA